VGLKYLAQEKLTVSASVGFTKAKYYPAALRATVQHLSGGEAYYTASGSAPSNTGANGEHLLRADGEITVKGHEDIENIRFIKKSGDADSVIHVRFEKIEGAG